MNLFVYGTLLFPEIREWVGGRKFQFEPATLANFQVRKVLDATFPGIVRTDQPTDWVEGEILLDINEQELARFDAYEDTFYLRNEVEITLPKSNTVTKALVYEIPADLAAKILSPEAWQREWFDSNHRKEFFNRISGRLTDQ